MTESKERSESGEWTSTVSDTDILSAVDRHEPAATTEIAETVGMTRQGVEKRLKSLLEKEKVSRKIIGASAVWYQEV
jgi:predicted ArsR family transcriptional regulator